MDTLFGMWKQLEQGQIELMDGEARGFSRLVCGLQIPFSSEPTLHSGAAN